MEPEKKKEPRKPDDIFWETYLKRAADEDKYLPDSWEANTGSILTFTGLFAATVAAFLVESYQKLSPDPGDQSVDLLRQLLAATANMSAQTAVHISPSEPFITQTSDVVNVLWFSSLLLSLVCALLATLIQEWARDYRRDINRDHTRATSDRLRAFEHAYIRMGIERYGINRVVYWITAMVHLAVILFVWGLVVFLFPINITVASISTAVLSVFVLLYLAGSLLPFFDSSCPYRSPVTQLLTGTCKLILASWSRYSHKLLPSLFNHMKDTLQLITEREVPRYYGFLTPYRFALMWDHTRSHLYVPFEEIMKILHSLSLENWEGPEVSEYIRELCTKDANFTRLVSDKVLMIVGTTSSVAHVTLYWMNMLSSFMFKIDDEPMPNISSYMQALHAVSWVAQNDVDAQTRLLASLCLICVRQRLITINMSKFEHSGLTLRTESEAIGIFHFQGMILDWYETFGSNRLNPFKAILSMQLFNHKIRGAGVHLYEVDFNHWKSQKPYGLVPLHENCCCQSWTSLLTERGWAHELACNTLTLISDILTHYKHCDSTFLRNFNVKYEDFSIDCLVGKLSLYPPSDEFVDILQALGLSEWLDPGSDFSSYPMFWDFLGFFHQHEWLHWCIGALRTMAKYGVDWEAYHRKKAHLASLWQVTGVHPTTRRKSRYPNILLWGGYRVEPTSPVMVQPNDEPDDGHSGTESKDIAVDPTAAWMLFTIKQHTTTLAQQPLPDEAEDPAVRSRESRGHHHMANRQDGVSHSSPTSSVHEAEQKHVAPILRSGTSLENVAVAGDAYVEGGGSRGHRSGRTQHGFSTDEKGPSTQTGRYKVFKSELAP